jgi:PAS domain S-box-containing protein
MNARIFTAEASIITGRAGQNGELSADQRAVFDAPVSHTDWGAMGASDHCILMYDEDTHLLDAVSRFTGTGLEAGEAVVVIATQPHRDHLEARLRAHGVDLETAGAQGQYVPLDAAETLSQFMVDGWPDARRFVDVVGGVIARAGHWYPRVRAFGEMVALLWAEGNGDAALQLEELWNDLAAIHAFPLLCAYPMRGFSRAVHAQKLLRICAAHSHVIPTEAYTALASPDERLHTIVQLQQKAHALEAEIAERQALEQALRLREVELADFLENAVEGLHKVGPDGIILWANAAQLQLLGYTAEEYIGHHVAEFHVQRDAFDTIWAKLRRGESLHDYPADLRSKDGAIKHVLIHSNAFWKEGEFVYTRCFIRDITTRRQDELVREQLAAIVASSDDAIIGKTLDGLITSWNRGAERIYGYTAAEVVGQPITWLIPPDMLDELPSILERLMRGERIEHYETQRVCKDGTRIDVSLTISPIRDSTGQIIGASKIARNITDRKRAEAALQQAHDALEQRVQDRTALLALMHDLAVAANAAPSPGVALQEAVDQICAYTGWPVGHVYLPAPNGAGHWAPTLIWHLADPVRFAVFQQATQMLQIAPGEGLIGRVGDTGALVWGAELTTDPAFLRRHAAEQSGLTTGVALPLLVGQEVVGVLEFYTAEFLAPDPALLDALRQIGIELGRTIERQRAQEQMQHQQEALFQREKLAAMGSLLASVAHELNNPLAIVLLQADLLREEAGPGPLADLTTELMQAATRCERLVRKFLTLARQHAPERSAVALNPLITETVALLAPSFQVDNIAVQLHLAADLPLLWADPHQLQQVVLNLLTNAQQALRDVSAPRQLTLTTQCDQEHTRVLLAVADTGPGIPPALQARIFEPFFTTKPPGVGTGLGLPLCRGIVEEHGGVLRVTSHPGQSTTFHVELPMGAVPATTPVRPGAAEGPAVCSGTMLLVEDEPGIANGLARLLRRDGHTVDIAANGRLALAKLQECSYDLLLSDVRMPELDGPGLYRILAQQQPHLCQRVIFLTGDTLAPETKSFLEQSGVRCLEKPFTIATVRRVLQQALQTL